MKKQLIAFALVSAGVGLVWQWQRDDDGGDDDAARLTDSDSVALDRLWIDKMPTSERETVNVFVALKDDEFGLFQATSMWRGNFEMFKFEAHGNKIKITYPQTGDREHVRLKARKCHEQDMDYCLEVSGASRGVARYVSREEWVIDNAHSAPAVVERIEALLRPTATR